MSQSKSELADGTEHFYWDDPDAPPPNAPLVPGVSVVVFDAQRRILIMKRSRSDYWSCPGGHMDVGESAPQCAAREMQEETGLYVETVRLISLHTNPGSIVRYPDGNVNQSFVLCFEARIIGGVLQASDEAPQFHWLAQDEIDQYKLIPDARYNVQDAWAGGQATVLR